MDLQEIQQHVDSRTGLVPIEIMQPYAPYVVGQIAGFPPESAVLHINGSVGRIPTKTQLRAASKVATVADPAPVHGSEFLPPAHPYEQRPEISPLAQTAPATAQRPAVPMPPAQIPENWKDLGVAERRKLAANLSLRRYQELSAEAADEIIQAAVDHAASGAGDAAPAHTQVPALMSTQVPTGGDAGGGQAGGTGGAGNGGQQDA
ncbi:hypothetical protein [Methylobacterium dankookense]|uniref:Uncharacterized protein n=1 Tax=Methylobacterium dankookense TaxID=560405 RepID=A0A564G7E4_9HYPH|nr:hypothetical protein [Methylobacterium dankookense]GJD59613.1 hypothetical protein IFDJLNFL_5542 [Methylobacterium dankookense]VUF15946.1 hypothetical protein MTDSW087_05695 [Methylobacterium dankookense]